MFQLLKKYFSQIVFLIFFALTLLSCAPDNHEGESTLDPKDSIDLVENPTANEFVDSPESQLL